MEYLQLGDLEGHLKTSLSQIEARQITQQLLEGLEFMHNNNFAHRDLKPSVSDCLDLGCISQLTWCSKNILVLHSGPEWWVKIADFGITKRIDGTALRTVIGTEAYLAPEVRGIYAADCTEDDENTFSLAVDIWAVGAITFRMVASRLPFPPGRKLFDYVVGGQPFPIEKSMSPDCANFVVETMAASPRHRPTPKEALSYPWIQKQEPILNDSDTDSTTRYAT
jgi:serine/threonine protein kinase